MESITINKTLFSELTKRIPVATPGTPNDARCHELMVTFDDEDEVFFAMEEGYPTFCNGYLNIVGDFVKNPGGKAAGAKEEEQELAEVVLSVYLTEDVMLKILEHNIKQLQRVKAVLEATRLEHKPAIKEPGPFGQAGSLRTLYTTIQKLTNEYEVVTLDMVLDEAKRAGIEPKDIDALLSVLKKNGDVYSPKPGQFKTTEIR